MSTADGVVEQAVLRLLSDGTPRTARQIIDATGADRRRVHRALLNLRGEPFKRPALVTLHAQRPTAPTNVWAITGAGRLTIRHTSTGKATS